MTECQYGFLTLDVSEGGQATPSVCPKCGSTRSYRASKRYMLDGSEIQRYLCRDCTHRYSFPPKLKSINGSGDGNQISALDAKNLEPTNTSNLNVGNVAKITEHIHWMQKQGYKQSTMERRQSALIRLLRLNADLADPESVKAVIASQDCWKASQKQVVVFAYDLYAKQYGYTWNRPWYEAVRELPFIPQEREIDDLIAGVHKEIGLLLLIAKETGARAGEIYDLLWTDIDFEGRTLSIRAEKNSNPRRFQLSKKLQNMLECYPKTTERIFNHYKNLNNLRRTFEHDRKRLAVKLCNPRLNQITIHTLRHWKGTTEYDKTKDILHVMQVLGHKNIKNTLLYTQLISVGEDKGYICKIAKTPAEAVSLIEAGFEEHTSFDNGNVKLFRKRK
ncbi:site-specific integrase [Candidatus Bathycorpusculum sp.]|uniref:tyrosine-type recombinase/integrase n=1 Tax=Candidatus Bathycorpusculum sp. TaxID=2994959 RepID=UPI0028327179|nr:tyrosine-type recombinase/integrase [Candidatus Termitimicrobium sp.]